MLSNGDIYRLTCQEVERKLRDAELHHATLAAKYEVEQRHRLERISIVAKSLKDNLKKRDNNFGLDLEAAVKDAQEKIGSKQNNSRGTSKYNILAYIRDIEGYTKIKYIPTSQSTQYPRCPLLK